MKNEQSASGINQEPPFSFDPRDLTRWDPVLRWMLGTKYHVVIWGFLISLAFNLVRTALAWADGFLTTAGPVVGFLNDYSTYSNFIFGWVIFSYYVWLPRGFAEVFNGLVANGVFCQGRDEDLPVVSREMAHLPGVDQRLRAARDTFRSPWLVVITAVVFVGVFLMLGNTYGQMGNGIWYTAGRFSQIMAQIWGAVLISALAVLICGFGTVIRHLRRIFRELTLGLRPAHIDGVGGLSPLGRFAVKLVYVISIVGIMLLAITPYTRGLALHHELRYTLSPELVLAGVAYFFLSPVLFFLVLGTASNAMRETKNRVLTIVCDRIDQEYTTGLDAARDNSSGELKKHMDNLEAAQLLYKTTQDFPVWPFDPSSLRKFTTSYFAPLATGLVVEVVLRLMEISE